MTMLSLDNKRWDELSSIDDRSRNIPELLERLQRASGTQEEEKIWPDIWSALSDESGFDTASYAVVPYIVHLAGQRALEHRLEYLHFVGAVEALRHRKNAPAIPDDLRDDYFVALTGAASLIVECLEIDWEESGYRALLGSLASVRAGLEFRDDNHGNVW